MGAVSSVKLVIHGKKSTYQWTVGSEVKTAVSRVEASDLGDIPQPIIIKQQNYESGLLF